MFAVASAVRIWRLPPIVSVNMVLIVGINMGVAMEFALASAARIGGVHVIQRDVCRGQGTIRIDELLARD